MTPGDGTYYSDGVTRITDPFYLCICPGGHKEWSCIYVKKCRFCGRKLTKCIPADQYKKRSSQGD